MVIEPLSHTGRPSISSEVYNADRFKTINMIVSEVAIKNAPEEVCVAHEDIVLVSELGKEVAVAPQVVEAYDYGYELSEEVNGKAWGVLLDAPCNLRQGLRIIQLRIIYELNL